MSDTGPRQPPPEAENKPRIIKSKEELETMLLYPEIRQVILKSYFLVQKGFSYEERDEITQETLFRALKVIREGKFNESRATLTTWLCKIAENLAKDILRKRIRRKTGPLPDTYELRSDEPSSLEKLITAERDKKLDSHIKELPPEQLEVLELLNADLKLKGVAKQQGVSINTVKSRKGYAVEYLRKRMRKDKK